MDKARMAEWLLTRVSTKQLASGMVGDLLEELAQGLGVFFWFRVAIIFFSFGWRSLCAPLLAMLSPFIPWFAFIYFAANRYHFQPGHSPFDGWMGWAVRLSMASTCIWTVVALTSVLYGLRDKMTLIAWMLAVMITGGSCLAWLPFAGYIVAVALALALCGILAYPPTRKPFLCVAFSIGGLLLILCMVEWCLNVTGLSSSTGLIGAFLMWCIGIGVEMWVLRRARVLLVQQGS